MSTPAPPDPPPLIGSWYVKILSGLARANELSLSSPGSSRDASPDHRDTAHGSESDGEQKELAVRKPQEIYTDLDPFLQLPTSVTRYERSRMQIYLTVVSHWFGSSNRIIPSPTLIHIVATGMNSAIGRKWMCILAEESLSREIKEGTPPDNRLILQKRQGYRELNQALQHRSIQFEDIVMGMTIMTPELMSFGSESQMNLHVTAIDLVLRSRTSLKDVLQSLPRMEPWYLTAQYAFGRCRFPSRAELDSIKRQWSQSLRRILGANRPSRTEPQMYGHRTNPIGPQVPMQKEMTRYVIDLGRELGPNQTFAQAILMSMLLEMAWIVLKFSDSPTTVKYLYERMAYLTERVVLTRQSDQSTEVFRVVTVAPVLSRARRDTISFLHPDALLESDTEICELLIPAFKMFLYLDTSGRAVLIERLSLWLTHEPGSQPLPTELDISALEEQIVRIWKATRRDPAVWGPI